MAVTRPEWLVGVGLILKVATRVAQTVLGVLLVVLIVDYVQAIDASACPAANCYPWGSEGPAAGAWNYVDKETYLRASLVFSATIALAIIGPFFMPGGLSGFLSLAAILIAGLYGHEWLVGVLKEHLPMVRPG